MPQGADFFPTNRDWEIAVVTGDRQASVQFLLIDDDPVSATSMRWALNKLRLRNAIHVVTGGEQALSHVKAIDPSELESYVLLLDIHMPLMSGLEMLASLRQDPALRDLTVFVLSSSEDPADVAIADGNDVAGYIVKDDPLESITAMLSLLRQIKQVVSLQH